MINLEPPRTNYDVNFILFGVPVRISPWFWVAAVLLGIRNPEPISVLLWILCLFVSILIHEFGHALAIRYYGWRPRVILYHFGGLAAYETEDPYRVSWGEEETYHKQRIVIAAAGPAAGFIFAAIVVGLTWLFRRPTTFEWGGPFGFDFHASIALPFRTYVLVTYLVYINLFWGLMNLLPVFPLDGGQIARELFESNYPHDGLQKTFKLGIVVAIVVAVVALLRLGVEDGLFFAILFGLLAYINYNLLQQLRGFGQGYGDDYGGGDRDW